MAAVGGRCDGDIIVMQGMTKTAALQQYRAISIVT